MNPIGLLLALVGAVVCTYQSYWYLHSAFTGTDNQLSAPSSDRPETAKSRAISLFLGAAFGDWSADRLASDLFRQNRLASPLRNLA